MLYDPITIPNGFLISSSSSLKHAQTDQRFYLLQLHIINGKKYHTAWEVIISIVFSSASEPKLYEEKSYMIPINHQ